MIQLGHGSISENGGGALATGGASEVPVRVTAALSAGAGVSVGAVLAAATVAAIVASCNTDINASASAAQTISVSAGATTAFDAAQQRSGRINLAATSSTSFRRAVGRSAPFALTPLSALTATAFADVAVTLELVASCGVLALADIGYPSHRVAIASSSDAQFAARYTEEVTVFSLQQVTAFKRLQRIEVLKRV